jgi:hypothetical protein
MTGVREYGATTEIRQECEDDVYNRLMDDAVDTVEDSEQVAGRTMDVLESQRWQIREAATRARSTRGVTSDARQTLTSIEFERAKKRFFLSLIIVALAIFDGWLAYLLTKHGGNFKG